MLTARRLARAAAVGLALAVPVATGTVPDESTAFYLAAAALVVVVAAVPWPPSFRGVASRLALVVVSSALSLALVDTAARVADRFWLEHRPYELFGEPYHQMPLIGRYTPNVRYTGRTYGALARGAALRGSREYRDVLFVTDAAGFPNDPATQDPGRPLDLILLGDSFGEGAQTSHDRTWGHLFKTRYGLAVYNLSIAAASPWHEYITLATEIDRLPVRKDTVLVWALFSGNDFDGGLYYATLDPAQLPWQGRVGQMRVRFQHFRQHSPVRRAVEVLRTSRQNAETVLARPFLDGRPMLFFVPYVARMRATLPMIERHPNFGALGATVAATATLAHARGVRLLVVLIPSKEEVYSWAVDQALPWSTSAAPSGLALAIAEMCARHQVPFLDLKPALVAESRRLFEHERALLWWRDDDHWNERGHDFAAGIVYRVAFTGPTGQARGAGSSLDARGRRGG